MKKVKQVKTWEDDYRIYLNAKKKAIMEKNKINTIIFDKFRKDSNPNLIENFISPMYEYLTDKYKEYNQDKNVFYVEQIFNFLKEKFKMCNPNTCHNYINEMYNFLENEKYCIEHFPNNEEMYSIFENFLTNFKR